MHPENLGANPELQLLVAEYEAMKQRGETSFLGEDSFHRLIGYYESENLFDTALEVVEHAITHYAFSADFYLKKAQLLIDCQRDGEALDALSRAEVFAPTEAGIQLLRAEVLAYDGRHEEALALLNDLRGRIDREDLDEFFFTEALVFECQSEFDAMYRSLAHALEINPGNKDALERLVLSIEVTRKHEDSIPLFQQLLDHNAYNSLAWYHLGHAYAYTGRYPEAMEAYEYAFLSQPNFEEAYRDCADLCLEMKQYQRALGIYKEGLERFGPDADLYFHMGQAYQALDQPKTARQLFREALKLDPLDDEVLYEIGVSFARENKWNQAARSFREAIQLEDKREEYYSALGEAYYELGQLDLAALNLRLALDRCPEEPRYWLDYAILLLEFDRGEEALELLEESAAFAEGAELTYCRVACLFELGRRQEALYWLAEALHEDYDLHYHLFDFLPRLREDNGVIQLLTSYLAG